MGRITGCLVVEQTVAYRLAEKEMSLQNCFDHDLPDGSSTIVTAPVN